MFDSPRPFPKGPWLETLLASRQPSGLGRLLGLLWIVSAPLISFAQADDSPLPDLSTLPTAQLFQEGNTAYDAGDYDRAIACYEAIGANGTVNGYVLYNQGNALHKSGDLGRAILAYERARLLIPGFADLEENLDYLNVLKIDREDDALEAGLYHRLETLVYRFTVRESAIALLLTWSLLGGLATVRILSHPESPAHKPLHWAMGAAGMGILLGGLHLRTVSVQANRTDGIVVTEEVAVRSGPALEYVTEFELHAGTRVTVNRREGAWLQIQLSETLRGWCPAETVEEI